MTRALPLAALSLGTLAAAAAGAQAPGRGTPLRTPAAAERGAFHVVRGADTIATEVFARGPARLDASLAIGRQATLRYGADLTADARVSLLRVEVRPGAAAADSPPIQSASLAFAGDSVVADVRGAAGTPHQRLAAPAGSLPYVNLAPSILEQVVRRARALGLSGATPTRVPTRVPMLSEGGAPFDVAVAALGADSVTLTVPPAVVVRLAVDADGRVLGGVVPSQGLRIVRQPLPPDAPPLPPIGALPPAGAAAIDYSAPAGAPYAAEEVRIPTPGGHVLAGTFTRPRGAGRVPAVLTLTGSGAQTRDEPLSILPGYAIFRQLADTLGRRGIAVLRLDDRGTGASTGTYANATTADFADDARAALAWLRARADVDPARLALLGHSEGGLVAPMVAAGDAGVRAIVLMAGPAYPGRRVLEGQLANNLAHDARGAALAPAARDSVRDAMVAQFRAGPGAAWAEYFLAYDPLPAARRVRRAAVLVLQGATDQQVTPEQAPLLADAFRAGGNRDVTVRTFPATNHLFLADPDGFPGGYAALRDARVRPEVLGAAADWLAARLAGASRVPHAGRPARR